MRRWRCLSTRRRKSLDEREKNKNRSPLNDWMRLFYLCSTIFKLNEGRSFIDQADWACGGENQQTQFRQTVQAVH